MVPSEEDELRTKLEGLGEDEVRKRLAQDVYGPKKRRTVLAWLGEREHQRSRDSETQERTHKRHELSTAKSSALAGWVSASVAVLSLIVASIALVDSRRAIALGEAEQVEVSLAPDTAMPVARIVAAQDADRIDVFWEALISNAGARGASLVAVEANPVVNVSDTVWSYRSILGGIFDERYRPLALPLFLEAGNSKRFFLRLGFRIDRSTRDRLLAHFPDSLVPMTRRRIVQVLRFVPPSDPNSTDGFFRTTETLVFDPTLRIPEPPFFILFRTDRGTAVARFTSRE